jgi:FkbM family methyltransferase
MLLDGLIFDIGFHVGTDTAHYLQRGHRVVAVEANPLLVQAGQVRFEKEIKSGRLEILHIGIWYETGKKLPFYVNETASDHSSFDPALGQRGGRYHTVEIECRSIQDLFRAYGVPWYLKSDIEGADEAVVFDLSPSATPAYLSIELHYGSTATLSRLLECGYTDFKLINQETYTQSTPIFDFESGYRALRKAGRLLLPLRWLIVGLPDKLRPQKIEWDTFREKMGFQVAYSSGPFGEETEGPWRSAEAMAEIIDKLRQAHARLGIESRFYYDLHARLAPH